MANKSVGFLTIAFGADLRGFDKAMKKAQRSIKKFGTSMQRTGKNLTRNLTLPLAAFAAASVKAFDTQAKAETKLLTALKGREDVQKRLIAQAKELQTQTLFGDEETIAAQAMLATMGLEEEAIMRLIPLVQDMATAKGMNLVQAADLVAKSVGSSTNALSRYGITITGAVGSQERLNTATEALNKAFGGQAEAVSKVGLGPLTQLKNILGDLSEDIGKIILPTLNDLAKDVKELALRFDGLTDATKKNIVKWGAITAAVGPFLILIGKTFTSIAFLIPLIVRLGGAFKKLSILMFNLIKKNPWLLLATGIAAIGVAIADTLGAFDKWLGTEDEVQEETDKTTDSINELNEALLKVDKTITKVSSNKPQIFKDLVFTPTQPLGEFMSPISDQFNEDISLASEQFGEFGEKLEFVSEKQKQLNAATQLFGDVMFNAMMDAANSQEGFFSSFIENMKKAIKQLLIQLAVMTAINILLGGKGMTLSKAFSAAKTSILGLQSGGLVTGPTMALVGEGAGTNASNPEVVAPLDKLKGMINGGSGSQQIEVFGRISGNDIFISNQRGGLGRLRTV
jgi:hypothetical protein